LRRFTTPWIDRKRTKLAYRPKAGIVRPDAEVPEEVEIEADPYSANLPLGEKCPHGFYVRSACHQCHPPVEYKPVVRDLRAVGALLTDKSKEPQKIYYSPSSMDMYEEITAATVLHIGDRVVRRIRVDEVGEVMRVERVFSGSIAIRNVWVDFCNSGRSTPYEPRELWRIKVQ
jgi:hypothetical protein